MSKRKRFIVASLLLSAGFIAIQFLSDVNRFWAVGALGLLTLLLFLWSLGKSIGRNMTLLTLVLPVIFTLGVGTFWFLLPTNIFARIPVVLFFGAGIYVLCLTMNIFTVSAVRTIALLRAARGVGFVLGLVTSFLVFDAILSLKTDFFILTPLIFISSFLLYFQGFWQTVLDKKFSGEILNLSLVASLITAEVALALYFWPVTVVVGSLFLTVSFYMLTGLGQAKLDQRLFSPAVREYLVVGTLVFVAMFFATHWGA